MKGAEAHTDHPATPPPDDARYRPDVAEQPHQPIPPQPPSRGWDATQPLLAPQEQMMRQARQQQHHLLRRARGHFRQSYPQSNSQNACQGCL
jgi:hypothetical protein